MSIMQDVMSKDGLIATVKNVGFTSKQKIFTGVGRVNIPCLQPGQHGKNVHCARKEKNKNKEGKDKCQTLFAQEMNS